LNILFRTDASLQIGTGHVMRCLTLARALHDHGAHCRFICRSHPGHMLEVIRQAGFEVIALPVLDRDNFADRQVNEQVVSHAQWLGTTWQMDAEQTIAALGNAQPDWLIVDHYALDNHWEIQLRPHCGKIMVIDDLADRQHDCDILLDQNLVANLEYRYDTLVPSYCARLLGSKYALLQPQYADLHARTPPRLGPVRRIFVYFGGADRDNLTGRAVEAFLAVERPDIALDVVINPDGPHTAAVREQIKGHSNISIYENLPSLATLMVQADLAIGAGGATSWERCCLGLPSILVTLATNQIPIAEEMHGQGFVRWLGDQRSVGLSNLKDALVEIIQNKDTLVEWSFRCRSLVDGKGAGKVAAILLLNANTPLKARTARLDDEALILQWANDPLVRQNAFNADKIDAASHRNWFYKRLHNPGYCQIYIVETDMGLPIGQVRFERSEGAWEIHYGLAAFARGRGLGAALLQTAIRVFRGNQKSDRLFGRVRPENLPSRKIFEHLGFSAAKRQDIIVYSEVLKCRELDLDNH
jgi:UDP-2,4-diacetamido-2,4,6-trideoxy-beta-L-altropyranose hydrolase